MSRVLGNFQDHFAMVSEFHGIAEQIVENLAQSPRITQENRGEHWIKEVGQFDALTVRRFGKQLDDFLDNLGQMKSNTLQFEFAGLDLRKIQNVIQ